MNNQISERIREFAYETCFEVPFEGPAHFVFYNSHLQKFAELIVREMCQVINADCELQYSEGVTTNLGGLNQARELIKQHFGVEE